MNDKTIIDALEDPDLFGGMFDAPSWKPWRAFLKALYALPMNKAEVALYKRHTARSALPRAASRYAQLVVGRRGGKSRILGLIAAYLACVPDHAPYIVPGETPVIAVIAADRRQAKVILGYVAGFLREIPLFAQLIDDELAESVRLSNGVQIEIHTASIGAPRGRTFLAVLADETAFWVTGDGANPDVEVINAVRPGLSTIPYSLLLIASSPYAKKGLLYSNFAKYHGKNDAPVLVWQGSTREMNSSLINDPLIDEMFEEDPERAAAEFGGEFRSDIVAFITREAVENCVAHGVSELPPGAGITYAAFVDPSGGSADSFTLAIGHVDHNGLAVLDAVREIKPPFSPDGVVQEYSALLKSYGINTVTGDAYAGLWPRERFAVHGISYVVSDKNKSAIYREFLPALNGARVQLLDLPRLTSQLCSLERRTARGGRDSIDHSPGAHDDLANAATGALVYLLEDRRPALISPSQMTTQDAAVPLPPVINSGYGIMVAADDGQIAVAFFARTVDAAVPLILWDFQAGPISSRSIPDALDRLLAMRDETRVRQAVVMFVDANLVNTCAELGVHAVPIPPSVTQNLASTMLVASGHVALCKVKICSVAADRAKTHPLGGAVNIRAGDDMSSPLRAAILIGISIGIVTNNRG